MATFQRRGKYNNKRTEYKGEIYDSKKEAEFARTLDILKNAKKKSEKVVKWERQTKFPCIVSGEPICTYHADFTVWYANGAKCVYDVKGVKTAVYKLKKKLVEALHSVEIIEV